MGTSSNNPGPNPRSPLVPPHADATPDAPVPPRPEQGLRNFRNTLTRWVNSGGGQQGLSKAVSSYVSGAVGGASTGARRFGAATSSSASAIAGLADLGGVGGAQPTYIQQQLSDAIGQTIDVAASIIARAVAPDNSEGDHVATVIQDAIIEACDELDDFSLEAVTEEFLQDVLEKTLVEMIYYDIAERHGGASLDKAGTPSERQARENELHDFVGETVVQQLASLSFDDLNWSDPQAIRAFQLSCVELVLASWEE